MKNLRLLLIVTLLFISLFCGKLFAASCTDDNFGNITCDIASGQETVSDLSGQTLTKTGAGETVLTGTNAIDNNINVNAGVLYITGVLQSGGVINVNGGILKGSSESLSVNIYNNSKTIFQQDSDGTFLAAISGSGDVEKRGGGTLILAGNTGQQNFTGAFDIIEGALQVNSVSLTRDANVSSGASIIFDQRDGLGIYANIISGDGAFIKRGLDTLTLSSQNTYSGGTFIEDSAGLIIGDDGVLGAQVSGITLNGGRLIVNNNVSTARNFNLLNPASNNTLLPNYITVDNSFTYTVNGILDGGSFVKTGLGTLVLTGQNIHTGGTQVAQGTLSVGSQNSLGAGFLAITDDGVFRPLNSMDLNLNVYLRDNGKFYINNSDTLNISGLLAGTGALIKDGAGIMSVTGGNIYEGGVQVLDGVLQGNTASLIGDINVSSGARLDFVQNFDGQYSGDITAAPSSAIIKSGSGILELTGNNTFDTFNINEGIAAAMSYFNGSVNIAAPATFIVTDNASGSINNSGNLYFLTSKDINFEGNISGAADSVLTLNVAEGSYYKLTIKDDGTFSKGNLNISPDATLNLIAQGTYVMPQTFELINYDGTLSGIFDNVFVADNKRITAELNYSNPGAVYITLNRLLANHSALQGLKSNQKAVAGAVDAASAVPSDDFDFVLNAAEALPLSSRARALDQLGGLIYANVTALNSFETLKDNAYLHLNKTLQEGEFSDNLWLEYSSEYLNAKENDNSGDLSGFSNGAVFGLDKYYSEGLRGGLVFSYTHHDMKHNGLEKLDGNEVHAGAYALLKLYSVDLKSVLTAGYRESDISRGLSFAGRKANGRLKSFGMNFDLELSVLFADIFGFELYPFAGVSSSLESRNSFAESGAGDANLYFKGDSVFYGSANAGLELRRRANSLAYYAGFGVKRAFNNPDMTLNIYNQDFTIKPFEAGTAFSLKAGAVKKFSDLLSLYSGAGAELNASYTNISFNLGMRSYW